MASPGAHTGPRQLHSSGKSVARGSSVRTTGPANGPDGLLATKPERLNHGVYNFDHDSSQPDCGDKKHILKHLLAQLTNAEDRTE